MQEERKRILTLVEEGKITSAEALTLLELLEKEQEKKDVKEKEFTNELSTGVELNEEEKKEQSYQKKIASAKDMFLDLMDSILTKVKEVDINVTKNVEINHIFHHQDVQFKDINIEVANGNVELLTWDQNDVKVEIDAKVYRTEDQAEARKNLLEDITLTISNNRLIYVIGEKWMRVHSKIFVPKEQYEKVRIRLFNGTVTGNQLETKNFKAKTAHGKVSLTELISNEAEIETANGNIDLTNIAVGKLECETINGAINSQGTFHQADFETFNGAVVVEKFDNEARSLQVKSVSGAIKVLVPLSLGIKGDAKSYLGGLHVEVEGLNIIDEKNEVVQKYLTFDSEKDQVLYVKADSKTAAVTIVNE